MSDLRLWLQRRAVGAMMDDEYQKAEIVALTDGCALAAPSAPAERVVIVEKGHR
jgi:hypothetical protein